MIKPILSLALLGSALAAVSAVAQPASEPPFTIVETGKTFWRLDDAVNSIGDRAVTIRIAPGVYKDCAVQNYGSITYLAAEPGTVIFDGVACDDKAALVLRGRKARVDGIVFRNMSVNDGNGAGIRIEDGNLEVVNSTFRDGEEGILGGADKSMSITIDRSTFSGLGRCDRGLSCAHSIYIGTIGTLTITNSRFERGTGGHYVKSWAARTNVTDSSFDDTKGRDTNYMIDLSGGGVGTIARNVFVQGANKENHSAFITVAPEARHNPSAGLVVADNTASISPGVGWSPVFVADWSHEPLAIGKNNLGKGIRPFEQR